MLQIRTLFIVVILTGFSLRSAYPQVKFLGNIHSNYNDPNFTEYWNQVTPENAGKWKTCEPNRDQYNWSNLDAAYNFAKTKGLPFKEHNFVWGNQYPEWMDNLSRSDQRAEVEDWIKDFGERYPDCEFIDVVNEPLPGHNPAPYREALGGNGQTGWDWVVTSFEWARKYCPNSKLLLNDFGIINDTWSATELAKIVTILKERDLIDGIGLQCHAFSMNTVSVSKMKETLGILSATGVPIYISELDIGGDENTQLERYKEKFPVLYNNENVAGITLWGYRKNHMWIPDAWLFDEVNNKERLALQWLKSFILETEQGVVVPGRIEAEHFFRHNGVDTVQTDSTILVNDINDKDWVKYVLNVLADEAYDINIKVADALENTKVYLIVDAVYTDTIQVTEPVDTLSTTINLSKGKHTFKLLFANTETPDDLIKLDWMDIYGKTTYYTIDASSAGNGSILPEGKIYVAQGDSITFNFNADPNYMPDSIYIDGIVKDPSPAGFTFYDVSANHSIAANFTTCSSTVLTPYYKINDQDFVNGADVSVVELDTLVMKVDFEEDGNTYWTDNEGTISDETPFQINNIQMNQSGEYGFYHTNQMGCKSVLNFNVKVNYVQLNVYQSEDYISQSGIKTEDAQDIGGGKDIGYIENGDWCIYEIDVESAGVYNFLARTATETNGGSIDIIVNDEVLANLEVPGSESNGWQDWYTTPGVEVQFEKAGKQEIKLRFKGGSGYLFNLNWFDLHYLKPLGLNETSTALNKLTLYPNPSSGRINIESDKDLESVVITNLNGKEVYAKNVSGKVLQLNVNIEPGIYFITFKGSNYLYKTKILVD